jgi:hypothetical protein
MAQLQIKVSSRAMPISTEFVRFCKGLEHFHYVMVLAAEPDAHKAAAAWSAWLAAGLNPAVRTAPLVDAADRIKVDSRPGVGGFEVTLSGANREAIDRLRALVEELEAARKSLPAAGDDRRLAAIAENRALTQGLLQPLKSALARSQIPPDGVDSFIAMVHQGLTAIIAREITSITVSAA